MSLTSITVGRRHFVCFPLVLITVYYKLNRFAGTHRAPARPEAAVYKRQRVAVKAYISGEFSPPPEHHSKGFSWLFSEASLRILNPSGLFVRAPSLNVERIDTFKGGTGSEFSCRMLLASGAACNAVITENSRTSSFPETTSGRRALNRNRCRGETLPADPKNCRGSVLPRRL